MANKYRNRFLFIWGGILKTCHVGCGYEQMFWPNLIIDVFGSHHYIWNETAHFKKAFRLYSLSSVVMDFVEPSPSSSLYRLRIKPSKYSNGQYGHCFGQSGHFGQNISCAY